MRYVVIVKSPSDGTEIGGQFDFDAATSFAAKLGDVQYEQGTSNEASFWAVATASRRAAPAS